VIQLDGTNGVNTAVGFVCGILGGLLDYAIHANEILSVFIILKGVFIAFVYGAAGVAGKEFLLYVKKRIKAGDHKAIYPYLKRKLTRKKKP